MKKFISVLLIVAMMATTMSMVFAGTVTAFAAESTAVTVTADDSSDNESFASRFFKGLVWFFTDVVRGILKGGIFSVLLDDIYEYIQSSVFDVEKLYKDIDESGLIEWVSHLLWR